MSLGLQVWAHDPHCNGEWWPALLNSVAPDGTCHVSFIGWGNRHDISLPASAVVFQQPQRARQRPTPLTAGVEPQTPDRKRRSASNSGSSSLDVALSTPNGKAPKLQLAGSARQRPTPLTAGLELQILDRKRSSASNNSSSTPEVALTTPHGKAPKLQLAIRPDPPLRLTLKIEVPADLSCTACTGLSNGMRMVPCTACGTWAHRCCAGLSDWTAEEGETPRRRHRQHSFTCPACSPPLSAECECAMCFYEPPIAMYASSGGSAAAPAVEEPRAEERQSKVVASAEMSARRAKKEVKRPEPPPAVAPSAERALLDALYGDRLMERDVRKYLRRYQLPTAHGPCALVTELRARLISHLEALAAASEAAASEAATEMLATDAATEVATEMAGEAATEGVLPAVMSASAATLEAMGKEEADVREEAAVEEVVANEHVVVEEKAMGAPPLEKTEEALVAAASSAEVACGGCVGGCDQCVPICPVCDERLGGSSRAETTITCQMCLVRMHARCVHASGVCGFGRATCAGCDRVSAAIARSVARTHGWAPPDLLLRSADTLRVVPEAILFEEASAAIAAEAQAAARRVRRRVLSRGGTICQASVGVQAYLVAARTSARLQRAFHQRPGSTMAGGSVGLTSSEEQCTCRAVLEAGGAELLLLVLGNIQDTLTLRSAGLLSTLIPHLGHLPIILNSYPRPSILYPLPATCCPLPFTLRSSPSTLHPPPSTLHPSPSTLHPPTSNLQPSTLTLIVPNHPHCAACVCIGWSHLLDRSYSLEAAALWQRATLTAPRGKLTLAAAIRSTRPGDKLTIASGTHSAPLYVQKQRLHTGPHPHRPVTAIPPDRVARVLCCRSRMPSRSMPSLAWCSQALSPWMAAAGAAAAKAAVVTAVAAASAASAAAAALAGVGSCEGCESSTSTRRRSAS